MTSPTPIPLRVAHAGDAEDIVAIYGPIVEKTTISFELEPPSVEEMARRITSTLEMWPWIVATEGDRAVGYAYAGTHRARIAYRWSVEASVYVSQSHRRLGLARRLYGALFELLRRQGFQTVYAGITLPNSASVGAHEGLGFRPVGVYRGIGFKHGAWRDVGWWDLPLRPPPEDPAPPVPFPELVARGDANAILADA